MRSRQTGSAMLDSSIELTQWYFWGISRSDAISGFLHTRTKLIGNEGKTTRYQNHLAHASVWVGRAVFAKVKQTGQLIWQVFLFWEGRGRPAVVAFLPSGPQGFSKWDKATLNGLVFLFETSDMTVFSFLNADPPHNFSRRGIHLQSSLGLKLNSVYSQQLTCCYQCNWLFKQMSG